MRHDLDLGVRRRPSTLEEVGGKAVNLSRLARAGFPVPPGFAVTTEAFHAASHAHGLRDLVDEALADADPDDPASVDAASERIRAAFAEAPVTTLLTEPVTQAVLDAYRQLGGGAVAVRSSATAEDLPDLSFAGQQDTLLGVTDEDALLAAVALCWSSLWTARAITYRRRAGIPEEAAALAVAVQRMVTADTSGVLFTANPLTGHRDRWPSTRRSGSARRWSRAWSNPTTTSPTPAPAGCSTERSAPRRSRPRRTPAVASRRATATAAPRRPSPTTTSARSSTWAGASRRSTARPQDIEWAIAEGEVALLQARAITSLFPVPDGRPRTTRSTCPSAPSRGCSHRSPRSAATRSAASWPAAPGVFGTDARARDEPLDRHRRRAALDPARPRAAQPARQPGAPRAAQGGRPGRAPDRPRPARRGPAGAAARGDDAGGRAPSSPGSAASPAATSCGPSRDPQALRAEFDAVTDAAVRPRRERLRRHPRRAGPFRRAALRARPCAGRSATPSRPSCPTRASSSPGPVLALRVLTRLSGATDEGDHGVSPLVLEITRALPHNVTTEMDLALWEVARTVRDDPESRGLVRRPQSGRALADRYASGGLLPGADRRARPVPRRVRDAGDRRDRPRPPALERRPDRGAGHGPALPGHPGGPVATRPSSVRGEQAAGEAIDATRGRRPAGRGAGWPRSSPAGSAPWPVAGSCRSSPSSG